jgi:hypothetical protein
MAEREIMGTFRYDVVSVVAFDDRVLAHLQIVIGNKLRRNESFYFSWSTPPGSGEGRTTIWLHPAIPLEYKYSGGRMPTINREWVELLSQCANRSGGLRILPEPGTGSEPSTGEISAIQVGHLPPTIQVGHLPPT